jgi:hypothetical protein
MSTDNIWANDEPLEEEKPRSDGPPAEEVEAAPRQLLTEMPEPIPLAKRNELYFDLALLPPTLHEIVRALSVQYQIDTVIPFASALGCIATATRGKITTMVSPSWIEWSSFYICSIALTGEGKSQVMNWLRKPLDEYEQQLQKDEKMHFALQQAQYEISEGKLKRIKDSLSNFKKVSSSSSPATQADLIAALDEIAANKPDPIPQILCGGDVTNDRLTEMLQTYKNLGILEAEGTLFAHLSGKRHNTGTAYETMLSAYTGDVIKSHRIGRGDGAVSGAHLIICTSVQPTVWHDLIGDDAAVGRGVIGRFIVLAAESHIGHRDTEANTKYPIPDALMLKWNEMLLKILNIKDPRIIELTEAGAILFQEFRKDWELNLRDRENHLGGYGTRMPGQIIRIATLFTLSEKPGALLIDDLYLDQAINLADFLLEHRKRADEQGAFERSPEQRILDKVAPLMRAHQEKIGDVGDVVDAFSFSERELQQSIKTQAWAKDGKMEAINAALLNLEKKWWLELGSDDRWYPRSDLLSRRW